MRLKEQNEVAIDSCELRPEDSSESASFLVKDYLIGRGSAIRIKG
ncbi:hypothetical protein CI610_00721 [invertebrate metagenome]|uniref:Uncharacterized protein n=1 Tax=invertebrate metagenome TaxID=1711999 RepID=A0A2H9TAS2_9ZZZZ